MIDYDILFLDSVKADMNAVKVDLKYYFGVEEMSVSYKKLWKILIDRDMKKKDLCAAAGISHASMAKLGKSENVTTDVLVKICTALQCDIGDIMELTNDPM
jgi:DNA-binding Xre family transcriptional regulator